MDVFIQDFRYALRSLRKNPGFAAVAVLTLGLGIGANTAIFSVVNGVLLQPLPFPSPERILTVWENYDARPGPRTGPPLEWTGRTTFRDWRELNQSFEAIAAYTGFAPTLTGDESPEAVAGGLVTAGYFAALGIAPAQGRDFLPDEETPGNGQVALLSHGLWQRRFGGSEMLGRSITLNGLDYTVVGILPPDFRDPVMPRADVWTPLSMDPQLDDRGNHYLRVLARLRPGVTFEAADADMQWVAAVVSERAPIDYADVTITLVPLRDLLVGSARTPMWLLLVAVGLVLLIACANVANLWLARASARDRELAVRTALGAGRGRLLRALVTESLTVAALGGVLGLIAGIWGMDLLRRFVPPGTPRIDEVALDGWVLAFTAAVSLLAGLVFGVFPAWMTTRFAGSDALREGTRGTDRGGTSRVRSGLVVAELALGVSLLVGAGLLIRSLAALQRVDPGFRTQNVVTTPVLLPPVRYPLPQQPAFWTALETRLAERPGVEAVGAVSRLPLAGSNTDINLLIEGRAPVADVATHYRVATSDYFRVLGIPLVAGRVFDRADVTGAPLVAVVNQAMAQQFFPGESPIGRRIRLGNIFSQDSPWWTIVGIVGDVRHFGLDQPPGSEVYMPAGQRPQTAMNLVVRSQYSDDALAPIVREVVWSLDPELPVRPVTAMQQVVGSTLAAPRFTTVLLGAFAVLALLLAVIGAYGVMSYIVQRRTREIGIRMALGARDRDVLGDVLRRGARLTALGLALGLGGSRLLTRMLETLLFGVQPSDPLAFAGAAIVLTAATLTACYLPARRAARVNPVEALRYE